MLIQKVLFNALLLNKIQQELQQVFLVERKFHSAQLLLHSSVEHQIKSELQVLVEIPSNQLDPIPDVVSVKMGQVKWHFKIQDFLEIFLMELSLCPQMVFPLKKLYNQSQIIMMGLHLFVLRDPMFLSFIPIIKNSNQENVNLR